MVHIFDGKATAQAVKDTLKKTIETRKIKPGLAVIIVGQDSASHIYVKNKQKAAEYVGIHSVVHALEETITMQELEKQIDLLNQDQDIHGILVQMPLPKHLNEAKALERIDPKKDVDGFHILNIGRLHGNSEKKPLLPCTPMGCMKLLSQISEDLSGLNAVIVGRSHIVGRPMAELLLQKNATVTIAHSRTKNLENHLKQADIIVAAVGIPHFIKADALKEDCILIDVGINRIHIDGKPKIVGDIDFDQAKLTAKAITPVPGGVGPMTIACLLENTLYAYDL